MTGLAQVADADAVCRVNGRFRERQWAAPDPKRKFGCSTIMSAAGQEQDFKIQHQPRTRQATNLRMQI
jgi:hypothetical protein